jgi:hypothetical protein
VRASTGYSGEAWCCLSIVLALPRAFLEAYAAVERLELGFIEYRLPTWAAALGFRFCREHPFRPWWGATERYRLLAPLRALPREIWAPTIALNLLRPNGARIFHPWYRRTPRGIGAWAWTLLEAFPRIALAALRSLAKRRRHARALRQGLDPGLS